MAKKRVNNIKVIKDVVEPETPEVLAAAIIQISESMKKLAGAGGLTNEALVQLICGMRGNSHLRKDDVTLVLDGLTRLKSYYIRAK
jgi:hypothetical protein